MLLNRKGVELNGFKHSLVFVPLLPRVLPYLKFLCGNLENAFMVKCFNFAFLSKFEGVERAGDGFWDERERKSVV